MILRGAEHDLDEPQDLVDVRRRYEALVALSQRMKNQGPVPEPGSGALSVRDRVGELGSTPPSSSGR